MQNHVKLEIALEVIINRIANEMNRLKNCKNEKETKAIENNLKKLLELKEEAYQGNMDAVEIILKKKDWGIIKDE